MKKHLLDVIFASDKRKSVLLILKSGPLEMELLLSQLRTTRQSLLPQMKILEENHLITHFADSYKLTIIGKLIVDEMVPLLDTIDIFEDEIDYWGTHNLDFISPRLLKRIGEIDNCKIIRPQISSIYELNQEIINSSYTSRSLFIITTFFHPHYPSLFSELIKNKVNVYAIVSKEVFDRVKNNYYSDLEKIVKSNLFHIYIYPHEMALQSFTYNDYYIVMRMLKTNGETDSSYLLCSNSNTLEWSGELFEYYLKRSNPITEI
ncbi:helix-turn-helix transcriptional regulator [Methanolobus halotolerans]|uniref:Transcriptional regulator n=1 Tax=Methanolobus halotolerans TaxID=2052935 RepID=A0A4E0QPY8_9EURY|nr:winged helix-turn-helix domain-containing protein [Methanolobus halotolerans]TGC06498.1 transcriptional regulator [Methanolobus halotolerans]